MNFLNEYVQMFRPSLKDAVFNAYNLAQGISNHDAAFFNAFNNWPVCFICNRKQDYVFDFVKLIPYFDMSQPRFEKLCYICTDHGRVTNYNCITSELIELPLPMPHWQRKLRNFLQSQVLYSAIALRFVWYYLRILMLWYVLIYPMWCMKLLKRKLCED